MGRTTAALVTRPTTAITPKKANTHRQPNCSTICPPTISPMAGAPDRADWYQPMARERVAMGNAKSTMAVPAAVATPLATPAATRNPMRLSMFQASPLRGVTTTSITAAARKARRWP